MVRMRARIMLIVVLAVAVWTGAARVEAASELEARGKYLFGAAGGCACHTPKGRPVNSGGRPYDGPFGTVFSANITPDPETGIGKWSDDDIINAIRLGRRPNGDRLVPVHPFTLFNGVAEEDLRALVAYLKMIRPVTRANQPKKITVPLFDTVFLPAWLVAFAPRETPPPTAPASGVARGEYLVRTLGHCGECHTPRTATYAPDTSRFLAGNPNGPENSKVANITPDPETGIGKWSLQDFGGYMRSGARPNGEISGGLMGELILGTTVGYKNLTEADLTAIYEYLKSIPPVKNKIPRRGGT